MVHEAGEGQRLQSPTTTRPTTARPTVTVTKRVVGLNCTISKTNTTTSTTLPLLPIGLVLPNAQSASYPHLMLSVSRFFILLKRINYPRVTFTLVASSRTACILSSPWPLYSSAPRPALEERSISEEQVLVFAPWAKTNTNSGEGKEERRVTLVS